MDWKPFVRFALLGSSDLEQYAILLARHLSYDPTEVAFAPLFHP